MQKIKQTLSIIIAIFLITSFVGCSISKNNMKNSIVGNYYNTSERCLEIRSDGKYKLEGDYGLGSWKILDDNSTVEFYDFYGEIQKTEFGKDEQGEYIKFNSELFYKDAYQSK